MQGLTVDELVDNIGWWRGLRFLSEPKSERPTQGFPNATAETREEMRSDVRRVAEIPEKSNLTGFVIRAVKKRREWGLDQARFARGTKQS